MITHQELHKIFLKKTSHNSKTELEFPSLTSTTQAEPPKKRKITDHFNDSNEHSMEAAVSRMIARDGLPIHIICSSWDVRLGLTARGFSAVPKSPNTVCKLVLDYAKKKSHSVVGEMSREKAAHKKFSLTFDEWTSGANKRYMKVNIHGTDGKFWNLGLIHVSGSMPSEKCIQLLEDKLSQYGLSLANDIVAVTTDGASVMTKVGRSISAYHQMCTAHGIQLGILEVLYKKKVGGDELELMECVEDESVERQHQDAVPLPGVSTAATASSNPSVLASESNEVMELVLEVEEIDETGGLSFVDDDESEGGLCLQVFPELKENIGNLISKVRKIVCLFKHSPTKNDDFLQK